MTRTRLALASILALLVIVSRGAESTIAPHPVPLEFASARYGVSVNGQPVTVFYATMNVHFASFDFTGRADVQVTINKDDYNRHGGKPVLKPEEFWQGHAAVRPLSRGIRPVTDGRTVTFSITQPGQYSIERQGTGDFEDEVLFLFANPPEKNVPVAADKSVIFLGPGIHQRSVDLTSGQTLYLAPGAVLFGGINVWDAENVRICGRGTVVYYGPQSMNVDTGWMHRRDWHPLTAHNVKGLSVEGVTLIGRSRVWTIQLLNTVDTTFDNMKVITSFPANLNGDGIDWYGGGRAKVRDSFFRVADDCFCVHTADSHVALRVDPGGGGHLPGAQKETPATTGEVSDITIERCVFWPTVANIFRAGWDNQSLTTRDITIRDCDIIHMGALNEKPWMGADWALFTAVIPKGRGTCDHSGYLFENIRVEEPAAILGVNWPGAHLRHFRFKDITFPEKVGKSFLRGDAAGLEFENVRIGTNQATTAADLNLTFEGDIQNLRFEPAAK